MKPLLLCLSTKERQVICLLVSLAIQPASRPPVRLSYSTVAVQQSKQSCADDSILVIGY